jgi:hypothetical protein
MNVEKQILHDALLGLVQACEPIKRNLIVNPHLTAAQAEMFTIAIDEAEEALGIKQDCEGDACRRG